MSGSWVFQMIYGIAFAVIPAVVGLVIVGTRGKGRAKTLGLVGFAAVALIGVLSQLLSRLLLPLIVFHLHMSLDTFNVVYGLFFMVLEVGVMLILALAVCADTAPKPPQQYGQPGYAQPGYAPPQSRPY